MKILSSGIFAYWFQITTLTISYTVIYSFDVDAAPVTGSRKVVVLLVYFKDHINTSRYSKIEVEDVHNTNLNTL